MSKYTTRDFVADQATVHDSLPIVPEADRSLNLPTGVFIAAAGLYFSFLAIMAVGFSSPGLIIPMAVFTIFMAAFFGILALFAGIDPKAKSKILNWSEFRHRGIATYTGRLPMRDALTQVLILPVLVVVWGLIVATIAALV